MEKLLSRHLALGLAAALALASVATVAAAQAAAYSVKSTVGELLDNPETKAVLNKYIPEVVSDARIDQGRGFPLEGITQYVPTLTPEMLARIDADLAKVVRK
jgi:para-nitrobenzyl esterase